MNMRCSTCKMLKDINAFSKDPGDNTGHARRCKACRLRIEKEQLRRNPEREAERRLKAWYGMTLEDLKRMFAAQNGCCAICDIALGRPVIDHCHTTNRVRGLLCFRCNSWLAAVEDTDFVEKANRYLTYHRTHIPEQPFIRRRPHVDALARQKERAKHQRRARWAERPTLHPLHQEAKG